ncbi:hypothetical protein COLO4_09837 [Corchorus olitorius]|uniref:Inner centromere protein ARK-binding domain-containing protein n=1 Tax=Corchorus olitorius TaxID=93759 RepID=A0A1R3KB20_9ROSI|nr:hypothetical protein COLO4_09837 [Corchorus olitorius]
MSTIEKALVQIFERKNQIIEHVKQQILVFDHHLASKCLIDGFVPPPWLLSTSPSELNKEDLISELLFPHHQPSIPYCSLYQQPVVTTDNVQLPDVSCSGVDALNEGLGQCLTGKADELDPSVTSPPQDCRDGMTSDICPDPGLSLARIQRSKSRQRALEHRSAKSCKKVESSEKNGDATGSQNKGSKIASLLSDPLDKLELIRFGDAVAHCAMAKGWSETVAICSVQTSKSSSGALRADNTSCVAKQDGVACTDSISKSEQQPGFVQDVLEPKVLEPIHNSVSCLVKTEERGQCWSKERGENIDSGRITRSRRSAKPPMFANGPANQGNGFSVTEQDGIVLTESINKSRIQPDTDSELLQLVKPVDNVEACAIEKKEKGECKSKKRDESSYSGIITRSRSCVQSPKSVNELSHSYKTSDAVKDGGNLLPELISESIQQHNVVREFLQSVSPGIISNESCHSRKVRGDQSMEKDIKVHQGRIRRSRGSSQQNSRSNNHLKLDSCPDRSINDGICKSVQLACSFDSSNESWGRQAKTCDYQKENAVVDQYSNGSTRSTANRSSKLLKFVDSSHTLEYEVPQSKLTTSNKCPYAKSSDRSEEVELKEVSGTQINSLPRANESDLADLNQSEAIVADTDEDSDKSIKSHSAGSASNLDGASHPPLANSLNRYERVELEVAGISPHSESAMMVMPKQLDFDNLGQCSLNEASVSETEEEMVSLEKKPPTPLPSADKMGEVPPLTYQEKCDLSLEKQLPEDQEAVNQKMESNPSQNQNANTMGRFMVEGIESVLDPAYAKSSEHVAIPSIHPGRHSGSNLEGSWPHKRRRIDSQQSISLSLSSKEEDITQLNTDKSLVNEDWHEGKHSSKEKGRSENTPSTLVQKQFDVASFSSFPKETLEDYEDHSVEGIGAVELSSIRFGSTGECTADENQILLNILDKSEFGNIEHLTCEKRSKQESKSEFREDGENLSSPISSPCQPPTDVISAARISPELEGFILQPDSEEICIGGDAISFDKLDLPKNTIARASILEQLCKSACTHTPSSQFPTTYRLHQKTDLYQSVPNGLLECMDQMALPNNIDRKGQVKVSSSSFSEDVNNAFLRGSFSDCFPCSSSQVNGDVKKPYLSPVGKLWDRITSKSGSSERRSSLIPELPCISEENEITDEVVDAFQEGSASKVVTCSVKRKPLTEIRECPDIPASVSGAEIFTVRDSLDSVNTAYSFTGTENRVKQKVGKYNAGNRRDTNRIIPPRENGTKRASESIRNRFNKAEQSEKPSLRKGGPSFLQKESKVNNIVSNISSFIPIVQQKQAASIITEEARRQQRAPEEKLCAKKDDKEKKGQVLDQRPQTMKVPNEAAKHEKMEKEIAAENEGKTLEMEFKTALASTSDAIKASRTIEDCNAVVCERIMEVMSTGDRATKCDELIADKSQEQSYDISPYKGSDDEEDEEDDDDEPNSKFIPSWARKSCVALVVTSQQKVDPEVIFSPRGFCSITEACTKKGVSISRHRCNAHSMQYEEIWAPEITFCLHM